jgi:hypothetical protein
MKDLLFDIQLANPSESMLLRKGIILKENILSINVQGTFDRDCKTLRVNQNIVNQLQLQIIETRKYRLEDNSLCDFNIVTVGVRFKNRSTICNAIISSENEQLIFGDRLLNELNLNDDYSNPTIKLPGIREVIK